MEIGQKIRNLRKAKKMTLEELSSASGVAVATLSRIETGRMKGTLESHINIARALGVSLPELLSDIGLGEAEIELISKNSHSDVFVHTDKSAYEMLTSRVMDKKMMPVLIKLEPGGSTHSEQTSPGTEKFIYVVEGKIEVEIANKKYPLGTGDSLYFEGSAVHFYSNIADSTARFICVISPPAL